MKKEIPNCAICRWRSPGRLLCDAQAGRILLYVYNNRLCKKLYRPKSEELENENNK